MAKQTLNARFDMNLVAVHNGLLWSGVNLQPGENYPSDYTCNNQNENADVPKTVHFTLKGQKILGTGWRVLLPARLMTFLLQIYGASVGNDWEKASKSSKSSMLHPASKAAGIPVPG